jgi:hypothetical protein
MSNLPRRGWIASALLLALIASGGCGQSEDESAGGQTGGETPVAEADAASEASEPIPPPEPPVEYQSSPEVIAIMRRLNSEEEGSLTALIGEELKEAETPWSAIQEQASEYKRLAEELDQYEPPRGTEKSWSEQTAKYAKLAADLDEAARARKKDEALTIQESLVASCTPCHREHRVVRPMSSPVGGGGRRRGPAPTKGDTPPVSHKTPISPGIGGG